MKTQLAWFNLFHNKIKTSIAIAGVVFAIALMFMQLGFLEAVKASATVVYDVLDFDVCLRSKDYLNLADARTFPRQRLLQALSEPGVASGAPLSVAMNSWRNSATGERRAALCFGVAPGVPLFRDAEIADQVKRSLKGADSLLIDVKTRREYGPRNGAEFGSADQGDRVEINGHELTIGGHYACGAGLTSGGAAILTERGLEQVTPGLTYDRISLGLLKVSEGESAESVSARLKAALYGDVDVLTREELLRHELELWVYETNYGLIFQAGVLVSLIVGTAIVYQVLASDVASLLPEYATLKAIGYGNGYLASVLLQQAIALAVLGYAFGLALSVAIYAITSAGAQIPVRMTLENMLLVFGLSVVMCVISGLAALRKVFAADPAELF